MSYTILFTCGHMEEKKKCQNDLIIRQIRRKIDKTLGFLPTCTKPYHGLSKIKIKLIPKLPNHCKTIMTRAYCRGKICTSKTYTLNTRLSPKRLFNFVHFKPRRSQEIKPLATQKIYSFWGLWIRILEY